MSLEAERGTVITQRRCRVVFTRDYRAGCPGAVGHDRHWRTGEEAVLWQLSRRPGEALDPARDSYWTDFDLDLAYIAPASAVRVVEVLLERGDLQDGQRAGST